jgi:hypothetical protein
MVVCPPTRSAPTLRSHQYHPVLPDLLINGLHHWFQEIDQIILKVDICIADVEGGSRRESRDEILEIYIMDIESG